MEGTKGLGELSLHPKAEGQTSLESTAPQEHGLAVKTLARGVIQSWPRGVAHHVVEQCAEGVNGLELVPSNAHRLVCEGC